MAYGTIKIDTITFTDGGVDKSVSISGLVQNPTFSGNITVTGTVSGNTIRGQTVSGVTVTGTTALFSTGTFISLTGTTSQGTTATYTSGSFTSLTGVTTSGTTANFVSGVFSTQISGATVTGNAGAFTTLTGGVTTVTSGVFAAGSASNPSISFTSDPNTGIYSPGADQVAISTGGSGRLFVDASGNVGVGGAPSFKLDVIGTLRSTGEARFDNGINFKRSTLNYVYFDDAIAFLKGGTGERLRIDSQGRLGLAASDPSELLQLGQNGSGNDNYIAIWGDQSGSNAEFAGIKFFNNQANSSSSPSKQVASLYAARDGDNFGGALYFQTANTSSGSQTLATRMILDSSGRLGVGTSSPSTTLHVAGTGLIRTSAGANPAPLATETSAFSVLENTGYGSSPSTSINIGASNRDAVDFNSTFQWSITTPSASASAGARLTFSSRSFDGTSTYTTTPRMTILGSGNVGIGTTSPSHALDVVGNINAIDTNGTRIGFKVGDTFTASTTAAHYGLTFGAAGANTVGLSGYDGLAFYNRGQERFRCDSSGRLLVGTSSSVTTIADSPKVQVFVGDQGAASYIRGSANEFGPNVHLVKSRNTSSGSRTIVQSGDELGTLWFAGDDGSTLNSIGALIRCQVDGTPGANDMPGRLVFSTTADGASSPTERMRISNAGTTTLTSAASTAPFIANIGASEVARIDSSNRLLVGTSSARSNYYSSVTPGGIQSETGSLSIFQNSNNTTGAAFYIGKSRGTTALSNTVVQADDQLGSLIFFGADGTNIWPGAQILAAVDGTPGTNDMPGRIVFSTTADGASSPTEAMRINNGQELLVGYTTDNGAYKLQVNSQIFATSATIATSDGRYKENVATLEGCVDLVKALRPVSFDWKLQKDITRIDDEGNEIVVREGHNFPDGTQVGFIAQEVQEVLADKPWLGSVIKQNVRPAVTDNNGNELAPEEEFLGIAEGNLIAVLTSALQEAISEIESLKARVAALESA